MSDELRALFRPITELRRLAGDGRAVRGPALRRPLLVLLALASLISLTTSGRLTLVLMLDAALAWSWIPAIHVVAALAAHRWLAGTGRLSPARAVDLYFVGFGPWLIWIAALTGAALLLSGDDAIWTYRQPWFYGSFAVVFGWSAWVDYGFFRGGLGQPPARAACCVVAVRAWAWGLVIAWGAVSDQLLPRLPFVQGQG